MSNTAVTSRQLHVAPSQRIGGEVKSYANASNNVPTVALNSSNNANVSSRREPVGNAKESTTVE